MRFFWLIFAAGLLSASEQLNIVLILADDLAWSDLGCYGATHCETPNLDRLARQGMRFTDAHAAAPICSPSRAALLTGKTPARLNFEFVTKWRDDVMPTGGSRALDPPPYTYNLPLAERTIAEVLRDAGYRTGMAGKWHPNTHHGTYLGWSPEFGPLQQGFEWGRETFGSHPWAFRGRDDPYEELQDGDYALFVGLDLEHQPQRVQQVCRPGFVSLVLVGLGGNGDRSFNRAHRMILAGRSVVQRGRFVSAS